MKLRSSLLLVPVVAGWMFGALAPAQAAPADPIVVSQPDVSQTPGSHDSWQITATWTEDDATSYSVQIVDQDGAPYTTAKSFRHSPAVLTASTLLAGEHYLVRVQPAGGSAASAPFDAPVLDTTAPTGTYKLDRTSAYLSTDLLSDSDGSASFSISRVAMEGATTVKVDAGDGSAPKAWTGGSSFVLTYTKPGVFTPHVHLSDEFANTDDITLPAVHVLKDDIAPAIRITTPANPGKARSWRTIRGTASDGQTGLAMVGVLVLEKRGTTWWVYDFNKHSWAKGETSWRKTESKTKANPAFVTAGPSGAWRTPAVRGLQRGTIRVEAIAIDNEFNIAAARPAMHRVK